MIDRVTKTISINVDNMELIKEAEIHKLSSFINELIEDALTDKKVMKRQLIKKLNALQLNASNIGLELHFNVEEVKK